MIKAAKRALGICEENILEIMIQRLSLVKSMTGN